MSQQTLIRKRAGNRGAVTRLLPKIQQIIDDATLARDNKFYELEKKLLDLHNKIKKIEILEVEIADIVDAGDLEDEISNADRYNSSVYDSRDAAEFILFKLKKEESDSIQVAAVIITAASNPVAQVPAINVSTSVDHSHLPKLDFPEFNGSVLLWNAFWDVFEVEVHKKAKYSDASKLNFLNSRLTGEAKTLLVGLTPNNQNFPVAFALLKDHCGQPQKIIMVHMRTLVSLTKPESDRYSLRKFLDNLESHIRGLDALGKGVDTYGDLLVCILLDKLSFPLRHNLARQHGAVEWTLDDLRKALRQEIEILEDGVEHSFTKQKKTNVMFAGSTTYKENTPKRHCTYCTGDYWPANCKETVTTEESMVYKLEVYGLSSAPDFVCYFLKLKSGHPVEALTVRISHNNSLLGHG
ncbi:Uncharacterized protein APZ42_033848 [Daphnia magna]|uniref:Uncharacterized protein n=1 Tax=Daphnia magna TaxID=35525 RepID=A0A164KMB7_9CRUS|nr:Uncharacterized protein APZ42_033848 [Daphnia magna]